MYPERHVVSVGGVRSSNDALGIGTVTCGRAATGAVGLAQASVEMAISADRQRRVGRNIDVLLKKGAPHLCASGASPHHASRHDVTGCAAG